MSGSAVARGHLVAVHDAVWFFFFSSRRRHTRFDCDWSSDVCSSDVPRPVVAQLRRAAVGARPDAARDAPAAPRRGAASVPDRKSTRLNSSHSQISYAVFCLKKKKKKNTYTTDHYK